MEQYTDSQYDDDLTIGADEYNDSFQTSDVDLFAFGGDEGSPISRLKTLVLSIDWEITDEVLLQFNDELLDLKDIWAAEKIRMVYLQALEKIGKYIKREKANAHPNAIKLLLGMYHNLERIVLSDELSPADKKRILIEDVRRFEQLKKLIGKVPKAEGVEVPASEEKVRELLRLKAIVLGIDWEMNEKDLVDLREEVVRLEGEYADSRPRIVFLQGIGTLGAYIRKKKSNAHADAFKLLHSFYEGLEKIVKTPGMTLAQEKAVLLPEVEKFNLFKSLIAGTLIREEQGAGEAEEERSFEYDGSKSVIPAFADMPEDETHGFQEEVEAAVLGAGAPVNVNVHIDNFFGEDEAVGPVVTERVEPPVIETEERVQQETDAFSEAFFEGVEEGIPAQVEVEREKALQGVDVETDDDDDSAEEALPFQQGGLAPALMDSSSISAFSAAALGGVTSENEIADEISDRLDSFFDQDEKQQDRSASAPTFDVPADVALQGVDVDGEGDDEEAEAEAREAEASFDFDELAPAFADIDDEPQMPDDILRGTELPIEPAEFDERGAEEEGQEEFQVEETALEADLSGLEPAATEKPAEPIAEEGQVGFGEIEETIEVEEEYFEELVAALSDEPIAQEDEAGDESAVAEEAVEEPFDELFGLPAEETETVEVEAPTMEPELELEAHVDEFFSLEEYTELDVADAESVEIAEVAEDVLEEPASADMAEDTDVIGQSALKVDDTEIVTSLPTEGDESPEVEEEEVVFELVYEDEEAFEQPVFEEILESEAAEIGGDSALAAGAGGVAGIVGEKGVDELFAEIEEVPSAVEELPELENEFAAVFSPADEEVVEEPAVVTTELVEEVVEEPAPEPEPFTGLRGCVQSIGLELNDPIIQGIFAEINTLRQRWVERPVEKTYLQLLSTVAQHVDQYRYDASDESHVLLSSIMDDLEHSQAMDSVKAQETLLSNICKVLQWQQNMLNNQAVRGEDGNLSFAGAAGETVISTEIVEDTVPIEQDIAAVEERQMDLADEDLAPSDQEPLDIQVEEALDKEVEAAQRSMSIKADDANFTDIVRREIDSLRETLQKEIADLKKVMKTGSGKE